MASYSQVPSSTAYKQQLRDSQPHLDSLHTWSIFSFLLPGKDDIMGDMQPLTSLAAALPPITEQEGRDSLSI